jgi:hypothetical protein
MKRMTVTSHSTAAPSIFYVTRQIQQMIDSSSLLFVLCGTSAGSDNKWVFGDNRFLANVAWSTIKFVREKAS